MAIPSCSSPMVNSPPTIPNRGDVKRVSPSHSLVMDRCDPFSGWQPVCRSQDYLHSLCFQEPAAPALPFLFEIKKTKADPTIPIVGWKHSLGSDHVFPGGLEVLASPDEGDDQGCLPSQDGTAERGGWIGSCCAGGLERTPSGSFHGGDLELQVSGDGSLQIQGSIG